MQLSTILTTLTLNLLTHTCTALPFPPSSPGLLLSRQAPDPVQQLLSIAPTASTCTDAPFSTECATASQAASPLISSFTQYGISSAAEQAALLSWMAFESGDFKYNQNHFPAPGRPGQGTRALLMPNFVAEYAASIPAVSAQAAALTDPAAVLALVQPDAYSFGAAAWFLSTQCSASVRAQLKTGTLAGWQAWMTGCVGTTTTDARQAYWERAVAALGV